MDNKDIEVLDDFEIEDINTNNQNTPTSDSNIEELKIEETNKKQEENPVIEMINNKKSMKFIIILLIILFVAVIFMPKFFELIGKK